MLALTEKLSWYVARASGLVAWSIVTVSILWGLALSSRIVRRKGAPAWLLSLHRYLGSLSLVFVAIHVAAIIADNYVSFGWADLFIPMASSWRPGATAWGIAAFYLLIAIQVTSWLMRRLSRRLWHTIHLSSLLLFISATVHGFQSGADRSNRLVHWLAISSMVLVVTMIIVRLSTHNMRRSRNGLDERVTSGVTSI